MRVYKIKDSYLVLKGQAELPRNEYDLCPRDFRNELSHNKEQEAIKKRYPKAVLAYADFMVPDEDIHQGIKNIGTRIENCCEVYHIKYNDSKKNILFSR